MSRRDVENVGTLGNVTRVLCRGRLWRRGFARVEFASVIAIGLVVGVMLVVMVSHERRLASLSDSMANLKQIGATTGQYAADYDDQFWSLSWRPGVVYESPYVDLRGPYGSWEASLAGQAVNILRLHGDPNLQLEHSWIPIFYNHVVLLDYLGQNVPSTMFISPADEMRQCWSGAAGSCTQYPPNQRSRHSSSYEPGWAFFTPDSGRGALRNTTSNAFLYFSGGATGWGGRKQSEVRYPSEKAFYWDQADRHLAAKQYFWMFPEARYPVLFVDGRVGLRSGEEANKGWDPEEPTEQTTVRVQYEPATWEPRIPGDLSISTVDGRMRYTRGGLGGRDFDADEVLE